MVRNAQPAFVASPSLVLPGTPGARMHPGSTTPSVFGTPSRGPLQPSEAGTPGSAVDPSQQIRVILADDHPLILQGLVTILRMDPSISILVETRDGNAALEAIHAYQPHVAVLDVEMPGRTGLEVATEIQTAGLPVQTLFVTGHREEEIFNQAMNLGVKGYVLKDSALEDIRTAVKTVAAGRRFISPALSDLLFDRGSRSRTLAKERPGLELLTPMERRVLRMVAMDRTSKEIADTLGISHRTVENHRANCASKLELRGSHSLLKFAFDHKAELI